MITIKEFLKYENGNVIEVTWVEIKEENFIRKEIIEDKEVDVEDTKIIETTVLCQSFSENQIDLLRQTAKDFNTIFAKEHEEIITNVLQNIVPLTQQQLDDIEKEKEKNRILSIKQEARRIIESKYNIYWQLNHPRGDKQFINDYLWIDKIRQISNEAEVNKTALEDIDWDI